MNNDSDVALDCRSVNSDDEEGAEMQMAPAEMALGGMEMTSSLAMNIDVDLTTNPSEQPIYDQTRKRIADERRRADLAAMVSPIKTKHVSPLSSTDAVELQKQQDDCVKLFEHWEEEVQVQFITELLGRMCHHQHGQVNQFLKPMLQRDFITALPDKGLFHVAEKILGYLDAKSLCAAEMVCKQWHRTVSDGMLWKKLIEHMVRTDDLWRGLAERKGW